MRKNILSPSILSADCTRLGEQIREAEQAGAEYLHIDVMDGMFVPSLSYGMCVISSLRKVSNQVFDVHLMVQEPGRYIEDFVKCGADILTVHLEACSDVAATLKQIRGFGIKAGLTLKPGTAVQEIVPYLDLIDMLLIMAVEPGFGGQKYLPQTTERIREAKRLIEEKGLDIDIEVDGGVKKENIAEVLDAGANVIVSGSGVFLGNITENVQGLMMLLK